MPRQSNESVPIRPRLDDVNLPEDPRVDLEKLAQSNYPKKLSTDEKIRYICDWISAVKPSNFGKNVCASCLIFEFSSENKFKWFTYDSFDLTILRNPEIDERYLPDTYDLDIYKTAILNPKGFQKEILDARNHFR